MKFSIKSEDGQSQIIIDIMQRSYPNLDDYWDGNWVNSTVKVILPGYLANFLLDLRTDEIATFLSDLKRTYQELKSIVEFRPLEPGIELTITPNKLGQLEIKGKTRNPIGYGAATLTFEFISNQSFLPETIAELEKIISEYPVKGKP